MDDWKLRKDVMDELDFEPSIDSASIGVAAKAGVVTLSGHVPNYAQKIAAERAARRVKGVKAVALEIDVRYPDQAKTADDEIAKRALDILRWDALVPPGAVQVVVDKGWVTLSGAVDWQYQKRAAEEDVRRLSGVVGVANSITIKPAVQVADVKKKIEDALKRHAEIESEGIKVTVEGGRVRLDGKVDNWDEREAAENAAWSAPGVTAVDDRLQVAV
ncbi:MAG: BON domain-containing protein [Bauldia sp.]